MVSAAGWRVRSVRRGRFLRQQMEAELIYERCNEDEARDLSSSHALITSVRESHQIKRMLF